MKQINETTFTSDNGLITFIHGDCMEFMAGCKENEFQLAVVDPPYGISIETSGTYFKQFKTKGWDTAKPNNKYFEKLKLVSKNQIIWGGNYFLEHLGSAKCFLIWDKMIGEGMSFADGEMAWTSFDKPTRIKRLLSRSENGKIHPTQKPTDLYRWIFKNYAKPTDHVLDTHGGSMSSAIAAHMEGLRMTIIELDKEYFDKALNRFLIYEQQQTISF